VRILLTGKNGQIGEELAGMLPRLGEVVALNRSQLDLADPVAIRRTIGEVRPRLIVNAAAYTAVDLAEKDEAAARAVNSDAPGVMAEEAKKVGAALVHFSTDYVFDGQKGSPYTEEDPPHPLGVYGRTKLAGEQAVAAAGIDYLIFRTSWIYATQGRNFLLTILRLASQRDELRVVSDQTGSPTCAHEVAHATTSILETLRGAGEGSPSFGGSAGTYHVTCAGTATWYDFARAILHEAAQAPANSPLLSAVTGGRPLARTVHPITTEEYPTPARRPPYSVLSNSRLQSTFGIALPDWRAALHDCFSASH
jgi:dTDP-4-dehydrorhamnose reductase